MSSFLNLETNLTEEKNTNFELNMENSKELSEIIINIFNQEYEEIFQNILLYSKENFLLELENNVLSFLEKIYKEEAKENNNFQILIKDNVLFLATKDI